MCDLEMGDEFIVLIQNNMLRKRKKCLFERNKS